MVLMFISDELDSPCNKYICFFNFFAWCRDKHCKAGNEKQLEQGFISYKSTRKRHRIAYNQITCKGGKQAG